MTTSVVANGETTLVDLLEDLPVMEVKTVSRLLVDLLMTVDATSENEGSSIMDLGIGVCSDEAFSIGNTAVPDPDVTTEYPMDGWLYVATGLVSLALPTGGTVTAMHVESAHFRADLRAQRKVDRGKLYMKIQNSTLINGITVRIVGRVRALCLT